MTLESPKTNVKDRFDKTTTPEDQSSKFSTHAEELVRIAEGSGIILLGRILERTIQYFYIIAIARMLGKHSFGLFMLGFTIFNFGSVISRFGLDTGAIRFVALFHGVGDKARVKGVIIQSLKYVLILSIIIAAGLFLAAKPLSAKLFNKPELEIIIKMFCLSIPFISLAITALACTQGVQIMRYTSYSHIFWMICNLILTIISFVIGFGLRGILAAHIISIFLTSVLSLHFLARTFPAIRQTEVITETMKLLRFSAPLLLTSFLTFLLRWTDTLMLGYFKLSSEVGVYNAAMGTAMLTSVVLVSFNSIFAPMISDLYHRKEMDKLVHLFKTTTKWTYTMSLPVFFVMVLLSKEIMTIFGQGFIAGGICLMILAFAQLVSASVGSVGMLLTMSGRQHLMMYNTLAISLFNILLNYLLIPSYGIVGASIASGISIIIFNIVMLLETYVLLKAHPYSRKFLKPTLFGMVAFAIILFMKYILIDWVGMIKVVTFIPLFLFVFTCLMYKWGLDEQDRFIISIFHKKLQKALIKKDN